MKKIILSALLTVLLSVPTFAQADTLNVEKDAKEAALKFCTFFEAALADIPPILVVMLTDFVELGEEQAQENFMASLAQMSPQEQQDLMAELPKLETFTAGMDAFFEEDMKQYDVYQEDSEFALFMITEAESIPGCEMPSIILKKGYEEVQD